MSEGPNSQGQGKRQRQGKGQFVPAAWGAGFVLGMFSLYIAALVLVAGIVELVSASGGDGALATRDLQIQLLLLQLPAQLFILFIILKAVRTLYRDGIHALGIYGGTLSRCRQGIVAFGLVAVIWCPVALVYGYLWEACFEKPQSQEVMTLVISVLSDAGEPLWYRGLILLEVVIGAAVAEELLFRALVHGWLRRYLDFVPAALLGGTLFGLVHVPGAAGMQWHVLFPLGLLGFLLCRVRESRGGLLACIVVHGLYNGTSIALVSSGLLEP